MIVWMFNDTRTWALFASANNQTFEQNFQFLKQIFNNPINTFNEIFVISSRRHN